jgi:hypothetical protein
MKTCGVVAVMAYIDSGRNWALCFLERNPVSATHLAHFARQVYCTISLLLAPRPIQAWIRIPRSIKVAAKFGQHLFDKLIVRNRLVHMNTEYQNIVAVRNGGM